MYGKTLSALLLFVPATLPAQNAEPQEPVISIDFPGGTLSDLLQKLRDTGPRLNITASALASDVPMPELSIKGATLMNVLSAASAIAPQEYQVSCQLRAGAGEPVYSVIVQNMPQAGVQMAPVRREARVFSLRAVIEPQPLDPREKPIALPVETVLSALDAGIRVGTQEAASLKFHRDSGLLFVHGLPDQVNVVQEVLRSLLNDQNELRRQLMEQRAREAAGAPKESK
jgi:hypothetical protein